VVHKLELFDSLKSGGEESKEILKQTVMGQLTTSAELQLCAIMRNWAAQSWSSALRPPSLTRE